MSAEPVMVLAAGATLCENTVPDTPTTEPVKVDCETAVEFSEVIE